MLLVVVVLWLVLLLVSVPFILLVYFRAMCLPSPDKRDERIASYIVFVFPSLLTAASGCEEIIDFL